jgi:putative folate metabolism gamma-glutamate ligase
MKVNALKTHLIKPGESITSILDKHVPPLPEGVIIAVTSKILSLCQGRIVPKSAVQSKYALIKKEADAYLKEEDSLYGTHLTIKYNILIPSAGIDESNGDDMYILYPENIQETARVIWQHLRKKYHVNQLGIIVTDSHTTPLRQGVTGIALGWCGFEPLYSYVGKPDIFNRSLKVTQVNILDALAASAVFVMGEGAEQTPIALMEDMPKVRFLSRPPIPEEERKIQIPLEEDIYAPLLKKANWIWRSRYEKP